MKRIVPWLMVIIAGNGLCTRGRDAEFSWNLFLDLAGAHRSRLEPPRSPAGATTASRFFSFSRIEN